MNYMSSYTLKHKRLSALLFSVNMSKYSISFSPVSWNISHICRVSSTFYIYFPSCISWRRLLVSTSIVLEDILVFISRRLRWEIITNGACVKLMVLRNIHIKQNSMILSCFKCSCLGVFCILSNNSVSRYYSTYYMYMYFVYKRYAYYIAIN